MSKRAVVSVSTTPYFARGQQRLQAGLDQFGACEFLYLTKLPADSPTHEAVPFGFKYHALYPWRDKFDALIWADCSILPVRSFEPLWQHIEQYGAAIVNGGWSNYEWTADSAYKDLFAAERDAGAWDRRMESDEYCMRSLNREIKHVVGGFFGLSMKHPVGRAILEEMYRLAQTRAFCGPIANLNHKDCPTSHATVCGPPDVRGHRHDQTALSVVAWRHGVQLVDPPTFLVYGKPEMATDERTVVVADGSYA
jgi:hypothetical protein